MCTTQGACWVCIRWHMQVSNIRGRVMLLACFAC
jgi:hypothetical protein